MSIVDKLELIKRSKIFHDFVIRKLLFANIINDNVININQFRYLCYEYFNKKQDLCNCNYHRMFCRIKNIIFNNSCMIRLQSKLVLTIVEDILNLEIDDDNIKQLILMGKANDLRSHRFGRLVVIKCLGKNVDRSHILWKCKCDCGNEIITTTNSLNSGNTSSCGCYNRLVISKLHSTHRLSNSPTYRSWEAMKRRCYNQNDSAYHNYGGRGITVCDRWLESFENFYTDMGDRPEGMTLDRINNDGNYELDNCRWESRRVQSNNRRYTLRFDNNESISDFAIRNDIPYWYVRNKFSAGLSMVEIINAYKSKQSIGES